MTSRHRHHIDYLTSVYDLKGRTVVDIGAGGGSFVRKLAAARANVTGVEIDAEKVALASDDIPGGCRIVEGRAEQLPLDDASQDLACFMYSFHHVPIELHDAALAEVLRVLRPDGHLHVAEPMPEAANSDVMRLIDDETHVRTVSHARMRSLAGEGQFELIASMSYDVVYHYDGFADFVESSIRVDPARAARFAAVAEEVERLFYRHATKDGPRYRFDNACTAYHFRRV